MGISLSEIGPSMLITLSTPLSHDSAQRALSVKNPSSIDSESLEYVLLVHL